MLRQASIDKFSLFAFDGVGQLEDKNPEHKISF
jgi:hypothetical protein